MLDPVQYTPFGTPIRPVIPTDCSKKELEQFGLELDKETGSTFVVEKDPIDLDEIVQSYKSQCGMEMAQTLLKRGLASEEDFYAKPGDYGDVSELPDNLNDAYQAKLAADQVAEAAGLALEGIKTDADFQAYVDQLVAAKLAAAEAAKAQAQLKQEESK